MTNVNGIEQGFDERVTSEALAYLLQTEHYAVVLHSGDMPAAMEKITWHMDDLRVGMCHQNWYAAKLAGKFVKVCLSGAGGDERFAGYPWRYGRGLVWPGGVSDPERYYAWWQRLLPEGELAGLFSPDLLGKGESAGRPRAAFEAALAAGPAEDPDMPPLENALQRILHFEFRTFLQGVLLVEDKISMAHSLEVRVPFLGNALADLAFRLPAALKLNLGQSGGQSGEDRFEASEGKLILRRAMREFLPESFTRQPKQGFSPPDGNWYRGESMNYILEILGDAQSRRRPWFNQKKVDQCLAEHFEGRRNHRLLIWSLLSFEWLQRHFCSGRVAVSPGRAAELPEGRGGAYAA
jgi:asparagine synthase (glutamine-hydrolysing)